MNKICLLMIALAILSNHALAQTDVPEWDSIRSRWRQWEEAERGLNAVKINYYGTRNIGGELAATPGLEVTKERIGQSGLVVSKHGNEVRCRLLNPSYVAEIQSKDGSDWVVTSILPWDDEQYNSIYDVALDGMNSGVFEYLPVDILTAIESATVSKIDGKTSLYLVEFESSDLSALADVKDLSITIDEEFGYAPVVADILYGAGGRRLLEFDGWQKAGSRWCYTKYSSTATDSQPPVQGDWRVEFDLPKLATLENCYLASYGLPEPEVPSKVGWLAYALLGSLLCVLFFAGAKVYLKRSD